MDLNVFSYIIKNYTKIKLRFLISNKTPLDSPKTTKEKFTWLEIPTWRFTSFIIPSPNPCILSMFFKHWILFLYHLKLIIHDNYNVQFAHPKLL